MQKSMTSVFANGFACALLLSVITILITARLTSPVHAQETIIYVDPPTITFIPGENDSVGTLFNVSVWVSDVENLCAYQVQIRFNESIVDCINATEPLDDSNYVLADIVPDTFIVGPTHEPGKMTIAGSEFPGQTPAYFSGTGLITIFTFNITADPEDVGRALSCDLNINNIQTFVLDRPFAQRLEDRIEDGFYMIVPEFSTLLMMLTLTSVTIVALVLRRKGFLKTKTTK